MNAGEPIRIAMWSGPRNISTALMRAFENRPDTAVVDEPLYAHYLQATGIDHPGRDQVLAAQPADWRAVAAQLTGPVPGGRPIFYQKHMAHHLTAGIDRGWTDGLTNAFLIRDPAAMLASYVRTRGEVTLADTGLPQQLDLFERLRRRTGRVPPVIDSGDVLTDPARLLGLLCDALGIPFDGAMLRWPAGPRPTDGVWAPYWYAAVERSTGFGPPPTAAPDLPEWLAAIAAECRPYYEALHAHRLR